MDLHFPREKVASLRDFAARYILIVAGILTALGVDQWREARANHKLAVEAEAAIRAELGANLKETRASLEENLRRGNDLKKLRDVLQRSKDPGDFRSRLDKEVPGGVRFGYNLPTLRRAAWNAGIASRALSQLPQDAVRRWSEAYSEIELTQTMWVSYGGAMMRELSAPVTRFTGSHGSLRDMEQAVGALEFALNVTVDNQRDLVRTLARALGEPEEPRTPAQ